MRMCIGKQQVKRMRIPRWKYNIYLRRVFRQTACLNAQKYQQFSMVKDTRTTEGNIRLRIANNINNYISVIKINHSDKKENFIQSLTKLKTLNDPVGGRLFTIFANEEHETAKISSKTSKGPWNIFLVSRGRWYWDEITRYSRDIK